MKPPKQKVNLDRLTILFCIENAKKVLEKEGKITDVGVAYDGMPIYANFEGPKDERELLMRTIIEEDRNLHERMNRMAQER